MPRISTKNVEKLVHEAATMMSAKWNAERRVDAEHIAQHVKASQDAIERMEALESMIRDLILFEKERLKSLQAHHEDMTTEEPALIEPAVLKRIQGGK